MKNDFNYKWSKLFASKRYNTKDGIIKLTPEEQQELLDDSERVVKKYSTPDISNFVLLCKPNYKAKDGTIKRGIEIDGKYYAPQNDC
jgi:hypothetical protein